MRFLLDVNVGSRIAQALSTEGHDVLRVARIRATADDPDVLAMAVADARILITYDRDFSELLFHREAEAPPGIIYLRYRPRDVEPAIARLIPLLPSDRLYHHMTVVEDRRIRHTPFPVRSRDHG